MFLLLLQEFLKSIYVRLIITNEKITPETKFYRNLEIFTSVDISSPELKSMLHTINIHLLSLTDVYYTIYM